MLAEQQQRGADMRPDAGMSYAIESELADSDQGPAREIEVGYGADSRLAAFGRHV